jgi:putative transposase
MARPLRLESEGGVVLNRGNYRADIFRGEKTKQAFLDCLAEVCVKTGWRVHAWCLMSNHCHVAVSSPQANSRAGRSATEQLLSLIKTCCRVMLGRARCLASGRGI